MCINKLSVFCLLIGFYKIMETRWRHSSDYLFTVPLQDQTDYFKPIQTESIHRQSLVKTFITFKVSYY